MAKSGEFENRFNGVDNIHQEIKGSMIKSQQILNWEINGLKKKITDEQSSLDGKVENIIDAIKELNSMLSSKEANEFLNQNATELS